MNGSDLPRRFPLISSRRLEPQEEEREQDTVVPGKPIMEVRNLVTRFPLRSGVLNRVKREVHAVENVSFDLWPGETLALVGESGCGKSTTGRALLRLVDAQEGSITFNGERIDTLPDSRLQAVRRDIQFIFQIRMPPSIRDIRWGIRLWSRCGCITCSTARRRSVAWPGCWSALA